MVIAIVWVSRNKQAYISSLAFLGEQVNKNINPNKREEILMHQSVYPLYSGISWSGEVPDVIKIGEVVLHGFRISSSSIKNVDPLNPISTEFENYYHDKLIAEGWERDNSYGAGGAGESQEGYTKGDDVILLNLYSRSLADKPGEVFSCPCDVTLSLFSGKKVKIITD